VFKNGDDYKQHLEGYHADLEFTVEDVQVLVTFGSQRVLPKITHCLFCGFEPESGPGSLSDERLRNVIMEHISKEHLQPLALVSLPWDISGDDNGSAYHLNTRQTDSAETQESIKHDRDLVQEYDLDEQEKKQLAGDPSLARFLPSNALQDGREREALTALTENLNKHIEFEKTEFAAAGWAVRLRENVEPWLLEEGLDRGSNPSDMGRASKLQYSAGAIISADEHLDKILNWISPFEIASERNQLFQRQLDGLGMCDWIFQHLFYPMWKSGQQQHAWLVGSPTLEKKILSSTVVKDIAQYCQSSANLAQVTFRFSSSDPSRRSFEDMMRSMIAQLGSKEPGLAILKEAYRQSDRTTLEDHRISPVLSDIAVSYTRIFLHIEGLDEFLVPAYDLAMSSREFCDLLASMPNLHLIASVFRNVEKLGIPSKHGEYLPLISTTDPHGDQAVKHLISEYIDKSSTLSKLPQSTKITIENTLTETSERR
jgi:hypothetical protein